VVRAVILPSEALLPPTSRTVLGSTESAAIKAIRALLLPPSAELPPPTFIRVETPTTPPPVPPIPPTTSTGVVGGPSGPVVEIVFPEEVDCEILEDGRLKCQVPTFQEFTFRPKPPPRFTFSGPTARPLVRVAGSAPTPAINYVLLGAALVAGVGIGLYVAKRFKSQDALVPVRRHSKKRRLK